MENSISREEFLRGKLSLNNRITALLPKQIGEGDSKREGAGVGFEVIGLQDHEVTSKIGQGKWTVDFKTLSKAKATRLVREGFPYLRKKTAVEAKKK